MYILILQCHSQEVWHLYIKQAQSSTLASLYHRHSRALVEEVSQKQGNPDRHEEISVYGEKTESPQSNHVLGNCVLQCLGQQGMLVGTLQGTLHPFSTHSVLSYSSSSG